MKVASELINEQEIRFKEISTPSGTVPANYVKLYFKNSEFYKKIGDTETLIGGSSSGLTEGEVIALNMALN